MSVIKELIYDNGNMKIYKYTTNNYEYREIHTNGHVITVESTAYIGVYVTGDFR